MILSINNLFKGGRAPRRVFRCSPHWQEERRRGEVTSPISSRRTLKGAAIQPRTERPWALRPALPALAAAACLLLIACGDKTAGGQDEGRSLSVVTTVYPLEYFAERIAGDDAVVTNVVPPGVEAHDFEPTPGDVRRIGEADMVAYIGAGFDPWVERALSAGGKPSRVVVQAIPPPPEATAPPLQDPHVWLDPRAAMVQVVLLRDAMSQARPAASGRFYANAEALISELTALDERFQQGLRSCQRRVFVTSHSAFGHLAAWYSLQQIGVAGVSPEAEPSPGEMAALASRLRSMGVRYLLVEPIISQELSRTLADELGAELLPLHPLESLTPDEAQRGETYFTIMEANLKSLRTALECS